MGKGINKIMEGRTKLPETSELKFLLGGGRKVEDGVDGAARESGPLSLRFFIVICQCV